MEKNYKNNLDKAVSVKGYIYEFEWIINYQGVLQEEVYQVK